MAFRDVDIMHPAQIHVKNGQLLVLQDSGQVSIPLEEISGDRSSAEKSPIRQNACVCWVWTARRKWRRS